MLIKLMFVSNADKADVFFLMKITMTFVSHADQSAICFSCR